MQIGGPMAEDDPNIEVNQSGISMEGQVLGAQARFMRRGFKMFCKMKNTFVLEFFRLGVYMWLAVAVFGVFYSKDNRQMENYAYFNGDQVVNTPEIKGLFPPVKGFPQQIVGRWQVTYINSLEMDDNKAFSQYTLEFKELGTEKLRVKRQGCKGDFMMVWSVYSYNMFIKDYQTQIDSDDMVISANTTDTECILKESDILDYLKNVSVWAIQDQCLFLLVEKWVNNTTVESILILERIRK